MFQKLHNHFVLTTMSLLTVVVVASFMAIYISAAARFSHAPIQPLPYSFDAQPFGEDTVRDFIARQRKADADKALRDLAVILTITGSATLAAGFFISQYLARRAIAPVKAAYDRQRRFVADASHELKTPLAVIDANIEAELIDRKKPSKWLSTIQNEIIRMNSLVTDLLALAQLDAANQPIQKVTFDISEVTQKALQAIEPLVKARSLTLRDTLATPLEVISDKEKVAQIIMILLDNAIKYTDEGGTIAVSSRHSEAGTEVSVANTYAPLPEEKLSRLFERFYQADESHHQKGHGLGLAIARSAAEKCGAGLSVSQADGLIVFTLSLPAA